MMEYKFYTEDDWNDMDISDIPTYEEIYQGFKIVKEDGGDYELFRVGRKRNIYMLDSNPDFPNQYEKRYGEPRYEWYFKEQHPVLYKNLTAIQYIKNYINSYWTSF